MNKNIVPTADDGVDTFGSVAEAKLAYDLASAEVVDLTNELLDAQAAYGVAGERVDACFKQQQAAIYERGQAERRYAIALRREGKTASRQVAA